LSFPGFFTSVSTSNLIFIGSEGPVYTSYLTLSFSLNGAIYDFFANRSGLPLSNAGVRSTSLGIIPLLMRFNIPYFKSSSDIAGALP